MVDEFILTSANDVFDSSDRGRSQSTQSTSKPTVPGSAVGSTLLQHRQCKSLIQTMSSAGLMTAVFQLLYNTISDDTASASADSWRHTLSSRLSQPLRSSWVGRSPALTRSARAPGNSSRDLKNEDSVLATGVDEEDEPNAASASSNGKKTLSPQHVPDAFIPTLLSDDVVSLLSTAYRFGLRLQATASASRDISFSVHRLRQCILSACSFTPQAQKPQHVPVLVSRTKHLCATLQSLVDEECASSSNTLCSRQLDALPRPGLPDHCLGRAATNPNIVPSLRR